MGHSRHIKRGFFPSIFPSSLFIGKPGGGHEDSLNKALGPGIKLLKFSCFIPVYMAQQVLTGCNSDGEASRKKELAHEVP